MRKGQYDANTIERYIAGQISVEEYARRLARSSYGARDIRQIYDRLLSELSASSSSSAHSQRDKR